MSISLSSPEQSVQQQRSWFSPKLLIALVIAGFSLLTYFGSSSFNPVTNKNQHVDLTPRQEIAIGLQSAPQMEQQYGGSSSDQKAADEVNDIGSQLVSKTSVSNTPYKYDFHLLADDHTINAFALPGGQVFITEGLFKKLNTPGEVACVLAHEVGHVAARHSAQQIAKQELMQGLTGAAVLASYDPNDPNSRNSAAVAAVVGQLVTLKFGRADELEADKLGVRFATEAGYDPHSMIKVMEILDRVSKSRTPEFFSTHPNPEHRIERIKDAIAQQYPNGLPEGLKQ
jgi:beta-barrel assembly-enhancing protease